jgi:hypothetical protein
MVAEVWQRLGRDGVAWCGDEEHRTGRGLGRDGVRCSPPADPGRDPVVSRK